MKRKIIQIDESLCNGCGQCVTACAEGAIKIINGKAKLVSDQYCDGLGTCLGHCLTGALKIIEREADTFKQQQETKPKTCNCPSLNKYHINEKDKNHNLPNWPIQLSLISPDADCLKNKELVIAADCTAFAAPDFKDALPENSALLIGCPKLDNARDYIEKLAQIFQNTSPEKVTVLRMVVPCCSALTKIVESALALANKTNINFEEKIVSIGGRC